jgi:CheY-like chemotaxis protein
VPSGRETVLVAEDENPVQALVAAVLEAAGHKVLRARHGEEALEICTQFEGRIHLLLTDVVMPGMSGPELSERVTSLRPDTRVLFMSGHTDDVTFRHGVATASTAFLQKPFSPSALAMKIREVLDAAEPAPVA